MRKKAIALLSGGLDSTLAIRLIQNQGIDVIALHFVIPFCRRGAVAAYESAAQKAARNLGVKLRIEYLEEYFLEILNNLIKKRNKIYSCSL